MAATAPRPLGRGRQSPDGSLTPCDGSCELQFCSSHGYSAHASSCLLYPQHPMLQTQGRLLFNERQTLLTLPRRSAPAGGTQRSTARGEARAPRDAPSHAIYSPQLHLPPRLAKNRRRHKTQAGLNALLDSHIAQPRLRGPRYSQSIGRLTAKIDIAQAVPALRTNARKSLPWQCCSS